MNNTTYMVIEIFIGIFCLWATVTTGLDIIKHKKKHHYKYLRLLWYGIFVMVIEITIGSWAFYGAHQALLDERYGKPLVDQDYGIMESVESRIKSIKGRKKILFDIRTSKGGDIRFNMPKSFRTTFFVVGDGLYVKDGYIHKTHIEERVD